MNGEELNAATLGERHREICAMKRKHSLLLFIPFIAFVIYFLSSLKSPGTRTPDDEAWQVLGFVITMMLAAVV